MEAVIEAARGAMELRRGGETRQLYAGWRVREARYTYECELSMYSAGPAHVIAQGALHVSTIGGEDKRSGRNVPAEHACLECAWDRLTVPL